MKKCNVLVKHLDGSTQLFKDLIYYDQTVSSYDATTYSFEYKKEGDKINTIEIAYIIEVVENVYPDNVDVVKKLMNSFYGLPNCCDIVVERLDGSKCSMSKVSVTGFIFSDDNVIKLTVIDRRGIIETIAIKRMLSVEKHRPDNFIERGYLWLKSKLF